MNSRYEVYEIPNTCTNDITLDEQIELGINDWKCEDHLTGAVSFGRTRQDAINNMPKT